MFEPNPDCFSILQVNTRLALQGIDYRLNQYGLGKESSLTTLNVPMHNWGGAFINDEINSYSKKILANKDGFKNIENENYNQVDIKIESAIDIFEKLFSFFSDDKLKRGIIKIDVEGYEVIILQAIAKTMPRDMSVMIVFENWDEHFDSKRLLSEFQGRAECFTFSETKPYKDSLFKVLKGILLMFNPQFVTSLVPLANSDPIGNLIIEVGY